MYLGFFSGFAGALSSFGFSQVPSLHFLSKVGMSFLRLIFVLDVFYLDLLVLSPVLASPTFPAYFFSVQSRFVLLKSYLLSRCI